MFLEGASSQGLTQRVEQLLAVHFDTELLAVQRCIAFQSLTRQRYDPSSRRPAGHNRLVADAQTGLGQNNFLKVSSSRSDTEHKQKLT